MKSYLKDEVVTDIPGLPPLKIVQLNVAKANEITEYQRDNKDDPKALAHTPAMVCRMCVEEWANEKIEDIEASLTWEQLAELSRRIYALSGMKIKDDDEAAPKNSEPVPSAPSSTV